MTDKPTPTDAERLAWMADGWTPGNEKLYVQHVLETGGVGDVDDHGGDKQAARRMASLRVAAEHGKTMP